MTKDNKRLFFIDAMRAWAILMMLQGHFVDGLLDNAFRNSENIFYSIWLYFRGITAPVFFTVSGFIFTYLLIKAKKNGWQNPRVKKGFKRGLQLILIGYLLRLNLIGLLIGEVYGSFIVVDVLHCIGVSLIAIVSLYLLVAHKSKALFSFVLLGITLVLFLFEPYYSEWTFSFLPTPIANYLTKANGSVFTIIPWLGYATLGSAISILFFKYKSINHFYPKAITLSLALGLTLIFTSSFGFISLFEQTGIELFQLIEYNNYLFIRLGDVFVVFAVFMIFRSFMTNATVLKIGANTLSIYVIHFIILYGSFTGLGLYGFLNHQLNPTQVILSAALFMIASIFLSLLYAKHSSYLKQQRAVYFINFETEVVVYLQNTLPKVKRYATKLWLYLAKFFRLVKN